MSISWARSSMDLSALIFSCWLFSESCLYAVRRLPIQMSAVSFDTFGRRLSTFRTMSSFPALRSPICPYVLLCKSCSMTYTSFPALSHSLISCVDGVILYPAFIAVSIHRFLCLPLALSRLGMPKERCGYATERECIIVCVNAKFVDLFQARFEHLPRRVFPTWQNAK